MALPGRGLIRRVRRAGAPDEELAGPSAPELIAALPTPLLVVDGEGLVQRANGAAEMLFNLAEAAMAGRPLAGIIGLSDEDSAVRDVASESPFAAYDLDLRIAPGRRLRVDLTAAPLPDHPGWRVVTVHARGSSLGVRRSERQGAALTAAGAAAILAHEIKNPLSGIRGAAQLLEASVAGDAADLTRLIRDEVDRVAALIDRMEGFTDTRPRPVGPQNIHAILGHAREVARRGFARDVAIRELYDPSLPAVLGSRDALIQVLLNLLKNAAEAVGAGGVITLTTAYRHGVSVPTARGRRLLPIEVCVIDDGPGAPDAIAEHLFEPFVTSKRAGSGLGLALVDKLIRDGGGIVEYGREGSPARTVFRLLLPRAEGKA